MKNLSICTLFMLGIVTTCHGQGNTEVMKITAGGSFGKPKIVPRLEKFALAQVTVDYKLTTTARTIGKGAGKMAGAKLTAYLETTDGELKAEDLQEVTDHFYSYFQKRLKENGVDTVAWATIKGTDFYQDADGKTPDNEEEKGKGQVWVTCNANKGNTLYGGKIAFAFGKIKKASRFCDEIGAPAGFFYLTVDFADVMVNMDISSDAPSYPPSYVPYTVTTTFKYHAASKPDMKVVPSANNTMLWNEKSQGENVVLLNEISSGASYHTAVNQDPTRVKSSLFAFAKTMDPVVIETTRAQYKAAAKKALEKYADTFIAKAKEMKKD